MRKFATIIASLLLAITVSGQTKTMREEIAAKVKAGEMDHEEAWIALSKLPRNANPIRQHNRCMITGRPKGYMRQFGISRIQFREMASNGLIPGVKKASW